MSEIRHPIINIRLMAIDNCLLPDGAVEWYSEKAYRYYSKTYHTPLHLAKQLFIPEEVIKIMMEDEMMSIPVEELQEMKDKLLVAEIPKPFLSPESVVKKEEEISDDEWLIQQAKLADAEDAAKAAQKTKNENVAAGLNRSAAAMERAGEALSESVRKLLELRNKSAEEALNPENLEKPIVFGPEE